MYLHKSEYEVRGYELDSFGHVNNAVYLNYLEMDRWKVFWDNYFISHEDPGRRIDGLFPVVIETKIRYLRELVLMDIAVVEGKYWCDGENVIHEAIIRNKKLGIKLATSVTKLIFVNEDRMIFDIPPAIKKLLGNKM